MEYIAILGFDLYEFCWIEPVYYNILCFLRKWILISVEEPL